MCRTREINFFFIAVVVITIIMRFVFSPQNLQTRGLYTTLLSSLSHLVIDVDFLLRLSRSVEVPVNSRKSRRVALRIHQLHVLESSHPEGGDDVVLQLREPHAEARMSADAPANISKLLVLVLGTVGEVSLGVESLRVGVDASIAVDVTNSERGVSVGRDDFGAFFVERDGSTRDILAESSARKLQADALPEHKVGHWELGLPGFRRDLHEAVDERNGGIGAVAVGNRFYLFENPVVPFLVFGQIEQYPCGVDSRIELTGKQSTEYKLMQLSAW